MSKKNFKKLIQEHNETDLRDQLRWAISDLEKLQTRVECLAPPEVVLDGVDACLRYISDQLSLVGKQTKRRKEADAENESLGRAIHKLIRYVVELLAKLKTARTANESLSDKLMAAGFTTSTPIEEIRRVRSMEVDWIVNRDRDLELLGAEHEKYVLEQADYSDKLETSAHRLFSNVSRLQKEKAELLEKLLVAGYVSICSVEDIQAAEKRMSGYISDMEAEIVVLKGEVRRLNKVIELREVREGGLEWHRTSD
jgi:hypothetical protein